MSCPSQASHRTANPRHQRGLAAVEFVVTAPLVLLMLLACAELGRAFVQYSTLSYTIREAARFVTTNSINGTTGVVQISGTTVTRAKNLAVYGNIGGTGAPRLPNYAPGHVAVVNAGGGNIRVVANYPYQPMLGSALPNFGFGSTGLNFNMAVAATMRAIS